MTTTNELSVELVDLENRIYQWFNENAPQYDVVASSPSPEGPNIGLINSLSAFARCNEYASLAKERLQIIVAHERSQRGTPDYLPQLKQDILDVIRKYVNVGADAVQVQFDQNEDDLAVLELNVTLPDEEKK